jgi:cysteine desulfurase
VQAYLDHAATSPLHPEALAAMLPFLTEHYGNPSAAHSPGRRARLVLDESRDQVAEALGCDPGEVVFCSGGTEAAQIGISGVIAAATSRAGDRGNVATMCSATVCSAIEHPAVLRAVLASGGTTVRVGADGVIDLDALESSLSPDAALVAVMLANNEVGTIQPIADIAEIVRVQAPDAVLFVDAVHAVPWLDVADLCADADMLAVSAHKFGGPKGSGALVLRNVVTANSANGVRWLPVARGGAQERERRPGTENVAGIAGMAAALVATVDERRRAVNRILPLRDSLADSLCSSLPGVTETAVHLGADGRTDRRSKVAGSCHLVIEGVEQDELMFLLDSEGVFASAGSACASGAAEPSHVLESIGVSARLAQSESGFGAALRLSLGQATTAAEIEHATSVIPKIVEHLRAG